MSNRVLLYQGLALAAAAFLGCATIFSPGPDPVDFGSEPQGAEVIVNGKNMGMTPVTLQLRPEKSYMITFRKDGYEDATITLATHVQAGWVVLDVLVGVLGVAVDAATGKWQTFDEAQQFVILKEADDR
jgi:hypothetical protein